MATSPLSWLQTRLAGTSPQDYAPDAMFLTANWQQPPKDFLPVWDNLPAKHPERFLQAISTRNIRCLVVFVDPSETAQTKALISMAHRAGTSSHDSPFIVWVMHAKFSEERPPSKEPDTTKAFAYRAMQLGLGVVVNGTLSGLKLALRVGAAWRKHAWLRVNVPPALARRLHKVETSELLRQGLDDVFWQYYREQCMPHLPAMDPEIEQVHGLVIGGYGIGPKIYGSTFGASFHQLSNDETHVVETLKIVPKGKFTELDDVKTFNRALETMTYLRDWEHPNIARFFEIYHGTSSLFYRLQFSGPQTLHERLEDRRSEAGEHSPLTLPKTKSILRQILDAVAFLHTRPKVCHRDIKPACFVLHEVFGKVHVQMSDFDLSMIHSEEATPVGESGTLPWAAPEVLLTSSHNAFAADVWSTGTVILDTLCGLYIMDWSVQILMRRRHKLDRACGREIQAAFGQHKIVCRILNCFVCDELRDLSDALLPLLDGTLNVDPDSRWQSSDALSSYIERVPQS